MDETPSAAGTTTGTSNSDLNNAFRIGARSVAAHFEQQRQRSRILKEEREAVAKFYPESQKLPACIEENPANSNELTAARTKQLQSPKSSQRIKQSADDSRTGIAETRDGGQQPPREELRVIVEKVQGSERQFMIDGKPITLSPACMTLLDAFIALTECGEPATPANLIAKLSPKYDGNRKRFEDDKRRFNLALKTKDIAYALYVVDDVLQLRKPQKQLSAKPVKKNGRKTVGKR